MLIAASCRPRRLLQRLRPASGTCGERCRRQSVPACPDQFSLCIQNGIVCADVDDFANDIAVFVKLHQFAFQSHRKFPEKRRLYKRACFGMQASLFQLVRCGIGRNDADIVCFCHMFGIGNANGKSTRCLNVFGGLMAVTQAEHHLIGFINAAPCCIHQICLSGFIIGSNQQNWHRIQPALCAKILSHCKRLLSKDTAFGHAVLFSSTCPGCYRW